MAPTPSISPRTRRTRRCRSTTSDLVFVGYGVVAPEANWNDYAGVDVKGKTVVMFVNDPGFVTNDDIALQRQGHDLLWPLDLQVRGSRAPGRDGALIIHEEKPAAYGWGVVEGSWTGEQADLVRTDAGASRAKLEGWIQLNQATELFKAAGLDIDKMRAAANKRGFKAVPMTGLKASATINQIDRLQGLAQRDRHRQGLGSAERAPAADGALGPSRQRHER